MSGCHAARDTVPCYLLSRVTLSHCVTLRAPVLSLMRILGAVNNEMIHQGDSIPVSRVHVIERCNAGHISIGIILPLRSLVPRVNDNSIKTWSKLIYKQSRRYRDKNSEGELDNSGGR